MFQRILVLLELSFDRHRRVLIESAIRCLRRQTQDQVHRSLTRILYEDDEKKIVRLCYGNVRPPHRAWFVVKADGAEVEEIPFDSVVEYGEHAWR